MNDNAKNQIVERLKQANNVLITVSTNPSVDQLAACIGLTLLINKLGKHGTAVFSGEVPSTIEFLKPEDTIEKNTDSLRDFIIALDKSKADKLRYKVEDKLVKIFITPYRTSLGEKDLQFSQGDFNVDAVIALGVHHQQDLDQAITSHGRILHDATVISINNVTSGELGAINWVDTSSSSLCELVVGLGETLGGPSVFDAQMATAFLTGIVAETNRFSNAKASAATMAMTSRLMAAGASTQLVAAKLEQKPPEPPAAPKTGKNPPPKTGPKDSPKDKPPADDGAIQIDHEEKLATLPPLANSDTPASLEEPEDDLERIHIDNEGTLYNLNTTTPPAETAAKVQPNQGNPPASLVTEPPALGGTLTANSKPEGLSPTVDPMSLPSLDGPLLSHDGKVDSAEPPTPPKQGPEQTLQEIEKTVDSPHVKPPVASDHLNSARDAVTQAIGQAPGAGPLEPIAALNAQRVDIDLGHPEQPPLAPQSNLSEPSKAPGSLDLPPNLVPPASSTPAPQQNKPAPPPPVPPPLMPPVL